MRQANFARWERAGRGRNSSPAVGAAPPLTAARRGNPLAFCGAQLVPRRMRSLTRSAATSARSHRRHKFLSLADSARRTQQKATVDARRFIRTPHAPGIASLLPAPRMRRSAAAPSTSPFRHGSHCCRCSAPSPCSSASPSPRPCTRPSPCVHVSWVGPEGPDFSRFRVCSRQVGYEDRCPWSCRGRRPPRRCRQNSRRLPRGLEAPATKCSTLSRLAYLQARGKSCRAHRGVCFVR